MRVITFLFMGLSLLFATIADGQTKKNITMTVQEKKQLVYNFIDLMVTYQSNRFGEVIAENYIQHNPMVKQGLVGIQEGAKWFESVFPDITAKIEDIIVEDDKIVARIIWSGTQKSEFLGIAATNKKVTWTGTDWWRIENGKLAEHWDVVDWASLMQQLQNK